LVEGVGFAGSSNASERASFVGFSVFAVLFCLSFLSIIGEGWCYRIQRRCALLIKSNSPSCT
jgi:hypothetical protein